MVTCSLCHGPFGFARVYSAQNLRPLVVNNSFFLFFTFCLLFFSFLSFFLFLIFSFLLFSFFFFSFLSCFFDFIFFF